MRLLTFQRQELVEEALSNGISYSAYNSNDRIKEIHQDFITEQKTGEDTRPLYCYAYCYDFGTPSIDFIARRWSTLMGFMRFSWLANCFIELDVPSEEILAFMSHARHDSLMLLKEVKSHCESIPKFDDDIEALIPCIKKEWIVSYTPYQDKSYSPQCLTPIILQPDKFPMYKNPVGVSGQGYYLDPVRLDEEEDYSQDDAIKPLVCSANENYGVAVWHLLSPIGIATLNQSLFGKDKIDTVLRDEIRPFIINNLLSLKSLLGRSIREGDVTALLLEA